MLITHQEGSVSFDTLQITLPPFIFFRDDDVFDKSVKLVKLLDIFDQYQYPINLGVIPAKLKYECIEYLNRMRNEKPALIHIGQHGYCHCDHLKGKTTSEIKGEFSPYRSIVEMEKELLIGRRILQKAFGDLKIYSFIPPWHTFPPIVLLLRNGYQVLSGYGHKIEVILSSLFLPVNLDIVKKYHPKIEFFPLDSIFRMIKLALEQDGFVGILLHHYTFDNETFLLLEDLLEHIHSNYSSYEVRNFCNVYNQRYPNFEVCNRNVG